MRTYYTTKLERQAAGRHDSRVGRVIIGSRTEKYKHITICQEWLSDGKQSGRAKFAKWAVANGFSPELDIDRIDNTKGYSPCNCRFVTHKENCNNKTNNVNRR